MKRLWLTLAFTSALGAPSLQAALQVTLLQDTTGDTTAYSSGSGGEFRAVANANLAAFVNFGAYAASTKGTIVSGDSLNGLNFFQTFCIEHNENFSPGTTYNVSGIGNNAMYGSTPPLGDPITKATAWLYSQFAAGTLAGYNYTYGDVGPGNRTVTAAELQNAIWNLEGEGGSISPAIQALLVANVGANYSAWTVDANGLYGVYALNVGEPGSVQDQLVIGTPVPEASTIVAGILLLLPFGASTIRILRKNRGVRFSRL